MKKIDVVGLICYAAIETGVIWYKYYCLVSHFSLKYVFPSSSIRYLSPLYSGSTAIISMSDATIAANTIAAPEKNRIILM